MGSTGIRFVLLDRPLLALLKPIQSTAGMKYFKAPINFDHIEIPERPKLRYVGKTPIYPSTIRAPKMQKRLRLMRGPEPIHNKLIHEQFGIIALGGGRLRIGHFEMIRLTLGRKIDTNRMFLTWRVDGPWQPVTKKSQGMRMGGGKGAIDHYVTPVKANRVIVELAGKCEFEEVKRHLTDVANKLPFKAMAVSHEMLMEREEQEKRVERDNLNPYTLKYCILNNMGGCQNWVSPWDRKYFGKYI